MNHECEFNIDTFLKKWLTPSVDNFYSVTHVLYLTTYVLFKPTQAEIIKLHERWCRNPAPTRMTFNHGRQERHGAQIVCWKLWSVQFNLRAVEFARLRHQSKSCTSLCMSVSLFHIPVTSHVVQLLKGYHLVFWIFFFLKGVWGLISSVPEGLSGMGWLHRENVQARHARDCISSIPVMEKCSKIKGKKTFEFTSQDAVNIFWRACLPLLQTCMRALQISVLVRQLFLILCSMSVCACPCVCVLVRVCTVCLNWKAVIKCVDLSTISSSSQRQWRTNRSTAMSHQAPRITTPPSISLSLPPSTSTRLSITLSASHYTFLCPTLSKLPTITRATPAACLLSVHSLRFVPNFNLAPTCFPVYLSHIWPPPLCLPLHYIPPCHLPPRPSICLNPLYLPC